MTMPSDDAIMEPYPVPLMEVFTSAGRRRTWSSEDMPTSAWASCSPGPTGPLPRRWL